MTTSFSKFLAILMVAFLAVTLIGCGPNEKESYRIRQQQSIYVESQPAPTFDWSLERHMMIELYKARNGAVATYSYVQSPYTGKVLWSCPSIGFPIPADTQITDPSQQEPNGLFTSKSTNGTYVFCIGDGGKITPKYEERQVLVSFVPMKEQDGTLRDMDGVTPALAIDPKKPIQHGK